MVYYSFSYFYTHWWRGFLGPSWHLALGQYVYTNTLIYHCLFPVHIINFVLIVTWFPMKALSIPLLSSYPFIATLSGLSLALLIGCASLLKNVLSVSACSNCKMSFCFLYMLNRSSMPYVIILEYCSEKVNIVVIDYTNY